jgi:hypothetical protein
MIRRVPAASARVSSATALFAFALAVLWLGSVDAAGTAALIGPGKRHTCVIRAEGSLVCYGEGGDGMNTILQSKASSSALKSVLQRLE